METFDPDAYLAEKTGGQSSGGFDPDAYLAEKTGMPSQEKGLVGKAWDALAIPEKLSSQGLHQIAGSIPEFIGGAGTSPTMNFIKGTPRVIADTLAEAAPGFVSRDAILTAGAMEAAKPMMKAAAPLAKGLANQAENMSGIAPRAKGALTEVFHDPKLLFAPGKKAAAPLYEAAEKAVPKGASIFEGMWKPEQIVEAAQEYVKKGGQLEPTEALTYRKAIDQLMKSGRYIKDELLGMRQAADAAAKASPEIRAADQMWARGNKAEALRNLLPQNKFGGTSAFKMAMAPATMGTISPLVQSVGALTLGDLYRTLGNPMSATALGAIPKTLADYLKQKVGRD